MRLAIVPVLLAASAVPALAHHGWSSYDASTTLTLTAPIIESHYAYPHSDITIEAEGQLWHVILAPPSRMETRGLVPEDLAVGTEVTVVGYPSTVEESELRAESITISGKTVQLR